MTHTPLSPGFFLAKITNIAAAPAYQFDEVWEDDTGMTVVKIAGRRGTAKNPGYAVNGAAFAVNDLALCRLAVGAAGSKWELVPLASGGSSTDCTGCGWLAGLLGTGDDCLTVSVDGTVIAATLATLDSGVSWVSDTDITICGFTYSVRFAPGDPSASPPVSPKLTLFETGGSGSGSGSGSGRPGDSFTGTLDCCGCNYAVWTFPKRALCPGTERDSRGPCYDTVKVRLDWEDCTPPVIEVCGGDESVSAGDKCLTFGGTLAALGTIRVHAPNPAVAAWSYTGPNPIGGICGVVFDRIQVTLSVDPSTGCLFNLRVSVINESATTTLDWDGWTPDAYMPFAWDSTSFGDATRSTTGAIDCTSLVADGAVVISEAPCGGTPCTPIAGWDGTAYYCIVAAAGDCADSFAAFLTDADRCDTDIMICSGPYSTLAEATAGCSGGGGGGITVDCCPGVVLSTSGTYTQLSGSCSIADGTLTNNPLNFREWFGNDLGGGLHLDLFCQTGGGWQASLQGGGSTPEGVLVTATCCAGAGNTVVVFDFTFTGVLCTGTARIQFTIPCVEVP